MFDWLLRKPDDEPRVKVGERQLPLEIRRHSQARRLTLRLAPDGSAVRVTVPRWARTADALEFARSRADWLETQLAKVPVEVRVEHDATFPFRGATVRIEHSSTAPRRPLLDEDVVRIGGPSENLASRLRRWLQGEARAILADDLAHYCAMAGRSVPMLSLSSAQRRWGSCSARDEIRINWRLIMAPDSVRRSVVAHEVAHLVHFDHSPRFHALLAELFEGEIDAANAWLKRHGRSLYATFG
jgi:predicted metal-dependent hydrolase